MYAGESDVGDAAPVGDAGSASTVCVARQPFCFKGEQATSTLVLDVPFLPVPNITDECRLRGRLSQLGYSSALVPNWLLVSAPCSP